MAKKRKVNNLLALAVLSVMVDRPKHRYEIAQTLRDRGKDQDMDIKWGSLYTVVQNLAKVGFLEVVGSERDGARPERVIYRITDAGRDCGRAKVQYVPIAQVQQSVHAALLALADDLSATGATEAAEKALARAAAYAQQ